MSVPRDSEVAGGRVPQEVSAQRKQSPKGGPWPIPSPLALPFSLPPWQRTKTHTDSLAFVEKKKKNLL